MTGEAAFGFPLAHAARRLRDMRAMAALLLVVAACGGVTVTEEFNEIGDEPLPPGVSDEILEDAAARVDVPEQEIEVASIEPATFEDSALGCHDVQGEDGEVKGFRVVLQVTDGELDYRVDEEGDFLLCISTSTAVASDEGLDNEAREGSEVEMSDLSHGLPKDLLNAILSDAASVASVDASQVSLISAKEEVFSDGSLGCPQKGQSYIQVLTPGWIVMVDAGGTVLEYHASTAGAYILCP
jgi:hypothetical protein